jgi:DNA-directed RNA polymerase specialized sigma24 family protein
VGLTDEDSAPIYVKISEKVLHLRRLGMAYADIAERLQVNLWMVKKAALRAKSH